MKSRWLAGAALAVAAAYPSVSAAQDGSGQPAAGEAEADGSVPANKGEIVVTARKREETLTDVPLTITAITEEQLDRANIDDVSDIAQQTPGLSFRQGFGRTGAGQGGDASNRPSIRGMSNILGTPNASFFVDGIYVSGNITSYQLDNLARVEVIKGPQSALFGRQTFSGAINFVTRRPANELHGKLKFTLGQYDHVEGSGYVNGAIIPDTLLFEVNARAYDFGGDYFNLDNNRRDIGDQRSRNIGAKLIFAPSPNFEATLNLGYSKDQDKGFAIQLQGSQKNNCFLPIISGTIFAPPFGNIPRALNRSTGYFCGEIEIPKNYAWNIDEIEARGYRGLDRDTLRTSLKLEANTDSGWTFTSVSAFNKQKNQQAYDNTYQPIPSPTIPITSFSPTISLTRVRDFSQEFRVMTPQSAPIRALAGVYYYKEDDGQRLSYNYQRDARYLLDTQDGLRNKAVFGLIEWDTTDRLTLTAEARYQKERIIGSTEASTSAATTPRDTLLPIIGVREANFEAFLPRFTARYELGPDWNVYGSAAKGNKPGGFNDLPTNIRQADLDFFLSEGLDTFDEETAWSYEIGTKGSLFDRRAWFSLSGFYVDWRQQQLTRSEAYVQASNNAPQNAAFIQNAGKSRIRGLELDVSGRPAEWLYMRFAYTFVDAKFLDFNDENTERVFDTDGIPSYLADGSRNPADTDTRDGQVRGNRLPQTPQHQFVVSTEIKQAVTAALSGFLRSDYSYESKRYVQVDNLAHTGDSHLWNLSTGVETDAWTLQLYVENLLNDDTPAVVTRLIDPLRGFVSIPNGLGGRQSTLFRDFLIAAPRKREIGASFTYRF
jgi:iron complex outermembrane recepter protein